MRAWWRTLTDTHLHWYLRSGSIASDPFWTLLRRTGQQLLAEAPAGLLDEVSPEKRVPIVLLLEDRRSELVRFQEEGGTDLWRWPARELDGVVQHALPAPDDLIERGVTAIDVAAIRPSQRLIRSRWSPEVLHLEGDLWLPGTDPEGDSIALRLGEGPSAPTVQAARRADTDDGTVDALRRAATGAGRAGWSAQVPLDRLPAGEAVPLFLELHHGSLERRVPVANPLPSGGVREALSGTLSSDGQRPVLLLRSNTWAPVRLVRRASGSSLVDAWCDDHRLLLRVAAASGHPGHLELVPASASRGRIRAEEVSDGTFAVDCAALDVAPRWLLARRTANGTADPVAAAGPEVAVASGTAVWQVGSSGTGRAELRRYPHGFVDVLDVAQRSGDLVLHALPRVSAGKRVHLFDGRPLGPPAEPSVVRVALADAAEATDARTGLSGRGADGEIVPVVLRPEVAGQLPLGAGDSDFAVVRFARRRVGVRRLRTDAGDREG